MTFQPPPPPQGPPPPHGPPPGQWGPPPGPPSRPGGSFDPKTVNPLDWGLLGVGFLTLIFSFFGFYTASYLGVSDSFSAWHEIFGGGFFGWLAMVLSVAGTAVLALELFAPHVKLPVSPRLLTLELFAAGLLSAILAIFIHPKFYDTTGISFGHGFSFWLSLILIAGGTVLALMRAQQTSTRLPGPLANVPTIGAKSGHRRSAVPQGQAGPPPGYGPPPPGYGPPPGYAPPPPGYGPPPAGPPAGYGPPPSGPPAGYAPPPSGPPPGYSPPPAEPQGPSQGRPR